MAQYQTDEEQKELLKKWWQENGTSILLAAVVGFGGYFGWQWWNNYQVSYAEEASALYSDLQDAFEGVSSYDMPADKRTTAEFLIAQLQDDYARSLYAANASLLGAKLAVDQGDYPKATEQLAWVVEHTEGETKTLASLRLARVYYAQGDYDKALAESDYQPAEATEDSFTALFADLRGDIYAAQGDKEKAIAAWEQALNAAQAQGGLQQRLLEIKLADLKAGQ